MDKRMLTIEKVKIFLFGAKLKELKCKGCGGIMNDERKFYHTQLVALTLIGIGIALSLIGIGLILAVPFTLCGLYMAAATQNKCLCRNCRAMLQQI